MPNSTDSNEKMGFDEPEIGVTKIDTRPHPYTFILAATLLAAAGCKDSNKNTYNGIENPAVESPHAHYQTPNFRYKITGELPQRTARVELIAGQVFECPEQFNKGKDFIACVFLAGREFYCTDTAAHIPAVGETIDCANQSTPCYSNDFYLSATPLSCRGLSQTPPMLAKPVQTISRKPTVKKIIKNRPPVAVKQPQVPKRKTQPAPATKPVHAPTLSWRAHLPPGYENYEECSPDHEVRNRKSEALDDKYGCIECLVNNRDNPVRCTDSRANTFQLWTRWRTL